MSVHASVYICPFVYIHPNMYKAYDGIIPSSYPSGHRVSWLSPIPPVSAASFCQVQLQRRTSGSDPRLLPLPPPSGDWSTQEYILTGTMGHHFSTSSRIQWSNVRCYIFIYTNQTGAVNNYSHVFAMGIWNSIVDLIVSNMKKEWWTCNKLMPSQ